MKVKDLIEALQQMDPQSSVYIDDTRFGTIGGSPKVLVMTCREGFDWDHGTVIIYPEKKMTSVDKDTIADMITYANQAGWRQKFQREIDGLKKQLEEKS